MKIIGRTSDGFILQAHEDEVYKLIGFKSASRGKFESHEIKVGDNLQVAAMFSQLYGLTQASDCIESIKEKAQTLIAELARHPAASILEGVKAGPDNA